MHKEAGRREAIDMQKGGRERESRHAEGREAAHLDGHQHAVEDPQRAARPVSLVRGPGLRQHVLRPHLHKDAQALLLEACDRGQNSLGNIAGQLQSYRQTDTQRCE
jgi:hypothetical protein